MNSLARIVMGLVTGLLGLAFLAGLLVALGVYIVFATLRWLLTGRKPQVVLVWQQFSDLRKGARWGGNGGGIGDFIECRRLGYGKLLFAHPAAPANRGACVPNDVSVSNDRCANWQVI